MVIAASAHDMHWKAVRVRAPRGAMWPRNCIAPPERERNAVICEGATFVSMQLTNTIFSALCAIGVSVAAFGGQDAGIAAPPDAGYRLGPKDSLTIVVFGHEELSGKFTVAADGSLAFPLIAPIQAADRTVPEVQAE